MAAVDYGIVIVYGLLVVGLGIYFQRLAAKGIQSYFLGNRELKWWALSMSGAVANFDIAGTMWIVSVLVVLGMKSMWHHWMWGFLMAAFFMSYMGRWVRSSRVLTAAEWMVTRFGTDRGGVVARTSYALVAIITLCTFIGYAFQGVGKFFSVYLTVSPATSAIVIISVTTLYVLIGGFYSVVFTQIIQTIILSIASLIIAGIAFTHIQPDTLSRLLPSDWHSILPQWRIPEVAGTDHAMFEFFGALVIVWVLKGLLLNAGGPAQMYDFQVFLAARNNKEALKVGALWPFFLIVRWAMCMGIALIALIFALDISDPEKVMPIVIQRFLPTGVRGFVIAGLFAAFMSTFSATVNAAASFVVRDIWQPFFKPHADAKKLVAYSRISTILVVLIGIFIGVNARSISQIWNWLMMALGAGVIIPNVLRWYWWRMNGWGYAIGTMTGILASLLILFIPDMSVYVSFPLIAVVSLFASITASLATAPIKEEILVRFYQSVHPFGWWGPVARKSDRRNIHPLEKSRRIALNLILAALVTIGVYLAPMYLVGHWFGRALLWSGVALAAMAALYFTWYKALKEI